VDADAFLVVLENLGADLAGVGSIKSIAEFAAVEVSRLDVFRDGFGEQVRDIDHDLLGGLERLRLDLRKEVPGKLIEPERDDERDEKERDPGEAHCWGRC